MFLLLLYEDGDGHVYVFNFPRVGSWRKLLTFYHVMLRDIRVLLSNLPNVMTVWLTLRRIWDSRVRFSSRSQAVSPRFLVACLGPPSKSFDSIFHLL
jgi:hypothetical protein